MASSITTTAEPSPFQLTAVIRQVRPKQWAKNAIVFAPLLFSGNLTSLERFDQALLCAVALCAMSSAVYTINDIVDIKGDKAHPKKRFRPLAAEQITIPQAILLVIFLLLGGFTCAFLVRPTIDLICLTYLIINLLYSFRLKNQPIIDILCIASGFVLRAVAGAAAVHVAPSAWFLMCTTFGALFLGLEKRRYELVLLAEKSSEHRQVLRKYSLSLIQRLESLIAPSLLATYSFYTFQSTSAHHGQWMMITIPIVLYGVMRYQYLSDSGEATGTPEEILWKDKPIQLTILIWIVACGLVIYGNPGSWVENVSYTVDSFRQLH